MPKLRVGPAAMVSKPVPSAPASRAFPVDQGGHVDLRLYLSRPDVSLDEVDDPVGDGARLFD
jgi:hypothetical protein